MRRGLGTSCGLGASRARTFAPGPINLFGPAALWGQGPRPFLASLLWGQKPKPFRASCALGAMAWTVSSQLALGPKT